MSKPLIAILLGLGWMLAALVLYQSGAWAERLHRYDDCTYVADFGPSPFYACPAESDSPVMRSPPEGEAPV